MSQCIRLGRAGSRLVAIAAGAILAGVIGISASGADPTSSMVTLDTAVAPIAITPDEPMAAKFSARRAAEYLDHAALSWQRDQKCVACHTMMPYVIARPALAKALAMPPKPRRFYEDAANGIRDPMPNYQCGDIDGAIAITTAAALSFSDRATTGKLQPSTRKALDKMWTLQKPDGSWTWPFRDTPPWKLRPHFAVTLAALAVGTAPGDYSRSEAARAGIDGIKRYLAATRTVSLHEQAMLAWASTRVSGLPSEGDRTAIVKSLLAAQRPDGGWSLSSLVDNTGDPSLAAERVAAARGEAGYGREFLAYLGPEKSYHSSLESDGYGTGLVVYIARQCGIAARDERLKRGIAWLKSHQRESGRWFTPSQAWHTQNEIANAGTAFAVLALSSCDGL